MKFRLCIFLIAIVVSWTSYGQVCLGNLGSNIFTDGDFGSGEENILTQDPMIAPGYEYTTIPPPEDGFYFLSNNTSPWASIFNWLHTEDNSDDPDGYMMVVNASFQPGLFYENEIQGLCENTLYEFTADIVNLITTGQNLIRPNVSFLLDGELEYSTGDIPEDENWTTYGFLFETAPGQTSVTLALRNNAPGGIGNDLAIDNISFKACGPSALILPQEIKNICEDGEPVLLEATVDGEQYPDPQFQWQQSTNFGATWQNIPGATGPSYTHTDLNAGLYFYRYLLANDVSNLSNPKCRVNSNIKRVRVLPKETFLRDTICAGADYIFGDQLLTSTGVYRDSLINFLGCDSIVELELEVIEDADVQTEFTAIDPLCSGQMNGRIQIDDISGGTQPYTLFINGEESPARIIPNLPSGSYELVVLDRYSCRDTNRIFLSEPSALEIDIGEDTLINLGSTLEINVTSSRELDSVYWLSDLLFIDCLDDCNTLEVLGSNSALLSVIGLDSNGCADTASISIAVSEDRNIYIPNTFSPNGDRINDFLSLHVREEQVDRIERVLVVDRWGNAVYDLQSSRTPAQGTLRLWDGRLKESDAEQGVYMLIVQVTFISGETRTYRQDLTLIR